MDLHLQIWDGCVWIVSQIISHNIPIYSHYLFDVYWISRGLGVLGFLGYIGFQSQNASFRATCAQKGREEKRWMLWFLLNQWSTGPTGVPEKLKQSETVGNSRKRSETVGNSRERPGVIMPKLSIRHFCAKKTFRAIPFFLGKCNGKQLETVGARTVSDCFRLFQFLWNASWTCGPLIQQKSQHSTLFLTTLLRAGCSKWCILTLKPNIP